MTRVRVTAPVKGFSGSVVGVQFADGMAVVDVAADRTAHTYFQRHPAYLIEPAEDIDAEPTRPAGNASTEKWAAYARAIGVDPELVDASESRADLISLVDAHDQEEDQ